MPDTLESLRRALAAQPHRAQCWADYVRALAAAGRIDAARAMLLQARRKGLAGPLADTLELAIDRDAQCHERVAALRAALDASGSTETSGTREAIERLLQAAGDFAPAWRLQGLAFARAGRDAEALVALDRAIGLDPDDAEAHLLRGHSQRCVGALDAALDDYRRAIELEPEIAAPCAALGHLLHALGRDDESVRMYRAALALAPNDADLAYDLGVVLNDVGNFREAEAQYRAALKADPRHARSRSNLGQVIAEQGRLVEAHRVFEEALEGDASLAEARTNLYAVLLALGERHLAGVQREAALATAGEDIRLLSNVVFTAHYEPDLPHERLGALAERFAAALARGIELYQDWTADPAPRRLRVGLVSADLCTHPVGYFLSDLLPALAALDIELVGIPTRAPRDPGDALALRLRQSCAAWLPIGAFDDRAAAAAIRTQGIHVLIDLAGHTAGNRLGVFARKPAPVAASWLGYFDTTGIAAIDALIADPVSVPAGSEGRFVESVARLPVSRLCFSAPADAPTVSPLPMASSGAITLGCTQNLAKINDDVLKAWAAILVALPQARLVVHCKALDDAETAAHFRERLQRQAIDPARVVLKGRQPRRDYLAAYSQIDFLLDTFPYPGGTTTCEALYMGVPTVTLAGPSLLSRQGASLMHAAGLSDWIAQDVDGYISRAIAFAGDRDRLAGLRARLRDQLVASPLMDSQRFARALRDLLWGLWAGQRLRDPPGATVKP